MHAYELENLLDIRTAWERDEVIALRDHLPSSHRAVRTNQSTTSS